MLDLDDPIDEKLIQSTTESSSEFELVDPKGEAQAFAPNFESEYSFESVGGQPLSHQHAADLETEKNDNHHLLTPLVGVSCGLQKAVFTLRLLM